MSSPAQPPPRHWFSREGSPAPLGPCFLPAEDAWNFALFSKNATGLTLLLYSDTDFIQPVHTVALKHPGNKTGRVWHCRVPQAEARNAKYYGWRVEGPAAPNAGHRFDPQKVLLDPYAHAVFFPPQHDRGAAGQPGSNAGKAPLGVLPSVWPAFDWENDVRPRHAHDTVIYEMHVKGLTRRPNSGVPEERRGTYLGVIDKIPYLLELGITVVELLPVHQYDPGEGNYWGYMTLNFFSPHAQYATDRTAGAQINEFRSMVKALHAAGIEVVLDVVYNPTPEAGANGPSYSYRGIDNESYYLLTPDKQHYRDDAGTGNVMRTSHPMVHRLVVESLLFWAQDMRVDGFRFDLASIFTRNDDGSINLGDPPIVSEISTDSAFEQLRLIAEAWDLSEYQLGPSFPGRTWLQWNGKFRDDVRGFVKGDNNLVGTLMRRLYGSDDLFPDSAADAYRPYQSVNFITAHDGYCLRDLVSYNSGTSWNCGAEGDSGVPAEVQALRKRQVKNFCALLMLANGTPMIVAGDEFMNTQAGDANPYNQDNETTWLDWGLLRTNADVFRFFRKMIAFRKSHPSIGRSTFWRSDVQWYGVGRDVDMSFFSHTLAYCLHGASEGDSDLYVMINAYWEPLDFTIQEGQAGQWRRAVDTSLPSPQDVPDTPAQVDKLTYRVAPRSVVVFEKTGA